MIVTFASQKGGVGKSTIAVLLATNLSYHHRKKVLFIDTDTPQNSIFNLRQREIEYLKENDGYAEKIMSLYEGRDKITIVKSSLGELTDEYLEDCKKKFDYVIIDIVGSVNTANIDIAFDYSDIVMIPFLLDDFSYQSTSEFLKILYKYYHTKDKEFSLVCFFNRVDGRSWDSEKNQDRVNNIRELSQLPNIEIMENYIPQRSSYVGKYLSTLMPMSKKSEDGKIFHSWMEEFIIKSN